ncbi:MAG: chitobiase/beta-hexosaminidase C-terminal domain-containing protein, partial [Chloroflexota bacterium]
LVAVNSGKLPNVCLVLTDLSSSAYGMGSAAVNQALENLQLEANRTVVRIDPVRLNTNELYQILRTRLFEALPSADETAEIADAYAQAVDEARRLDLTTASPPQTRADVINAFPFHPAIRDLYARFRENSGFQQTRALIRIMRIVVAELWTNGKARRQSLIGAQDLDLHRGDVLSEIRQINPSLDNAVAHDIAADGGGAAAEAIDDGGRTDARDAATLIFLSSLSQAVSPTLGLSRSEIVGYLAAPGRAPSFLTDAIDQLQASAWYLHATSAGSLLFRNVENLVAKQDTYTRGMLREQREGELRKRLTDLFQPKTRTCYAELACLPALDQVTLGPDRVTLVIFRPGELALEEIRRFFENQTYKNRVMFLTGYAGAYDQVLQRGASLRAIGMIIDEFRAGGMREDEPQFKDAVGIETREQTLFYQGCRETFQLLHYPSRNGLNPVPLELASGSSAFDGEQQIQTTLQINYKYRADTSDLSFRVSLENKLWPADAREVLWSELKRRAATDPSWSFHHPRALDDLKDELIRKDVWRDVGNGYVERGPFPRPPASVTVRQQARDDATGEATLTISPLHADIVYVSDSGAATTASPRLNTFSNYKTRALGLSFLAADSTGEHETGDPMTWKNTISVRYRLYQEGVGHTCELQALPRGEIRYTLDGSSPETSGQPYDEPFVVPTATRVILAQASAKGITSAPLRIDVPQDRGAAGHPPGPVVNPDKPARWKHRHRLDATGEVYSWIEQLGKFNGEAGGVKLVIGKDRYWAELTAADELLLPATALGEQVDGLGRLVPGGNLNLTVEVTRFARGQDLLDLVAALKTQLGPDEVSQ